MRRGAPRAAYNHSASGWQEQLHSASRKLHRPSPEHLDFDECQALAVKAIWALGGIPGAEARGALKSLHDAENQIIRENAAKQPARHGEL